MLLALRHEGSDRRLVVDHLVHGRRAGIDNGRGLRRYAMIHQIRQAGEGELGRLVRHGFRNQVEVGIQGRCKPRMIVPGDAQVLLQRSHGRVLIVHFLRNLRLGDQQIGIHGPAGIPELAQPVEGGGEILRGEGRIDLLAQQHAPLGVGEVAVECFHKARDRVDGDQRIGHVAGESALRSSGKCTDPVNDFHAFDDAAEDRITRFAAGGIEGGIVRQVHEKLRRG